MAHSAAVVMISAWHDDDGVRSRVTLEQATERVVLTCTSIAETVDAVREALERWDHAAPSR
jgi:hypothetical protein